MLRGQMPAALLWAAAVAAAVDPAKVKRVHLIHVRSRPSRTAPLAAPLVVVHHPPPSQRLPA
eukprot:COSAG04_NODE_9556_length_852_cov_1.001328_1_plen_62_part_00